MKLFILALDGLEHSLIEKWNLTGLMQHKHGTHDASGLEVLTTPICFSAILFGEDPRIYGYTYNFFLKGYDYGYNSLLRPFFWFRRKLFSRWKDLGLRKKAIEIGAFKTNLVRNNMSEEMRNHTILRKLEKEGYSIKTDNIPAYDEIPKENLRGLLFKMIGKPLYKRQEHVNELMNVVRMRFIRNIEEIPNRDLIFIYSPLPDIAHHLVHERQDMELMLRNVYEKLDRLVSDFALKKIAMLILSDHGFNHSFDENGKCIEAEHGIQGFWSVNIDSEGAKTIFDFHDLIYNLIKI
jgi:hypothetical protein